MSFRIVQNLTDTGFEGRHCSVTKDGKIKKKGGYITHHLNKKVTAIVQDGQINKVSQILAPEK